MSTCPTCQTSFDGTLRVCPVDGTALGGPDPLIGRVLGDRYRVLGLIAEGGMGTVYRAEHVVLGRRLAVKVLRPEFSTDEDLVRRFQREAVAASKLGQENIVDVTDFGRTREGNLYFVMEQLEGRSLAAVLHAEGPLPFDRTALILAQLCRALAAAHGHGIVHRDLKPDNLVLLRRDDGSDFVKVVDFGISKSPGEGEDRITRAGTIIGTPEYMAPEQGSATAVDHRADVYAVGVLAYEVLTGGLPIEGATPIATLLAAQTRAPDPPSRRRPAIPPEVDGLVLRALAKRPEDRFPSMREMAGEIARLRAGLLGSAPDPRPPAITAEYTRSTRPSGPRGETVAIAGGPERPSPAPPAPRRRRALLAGAAALGAVAAAALAGYWARGERLLAAASASSTPTPTPTASPPPTPTASPPPTPTASPTPTPTPTASPTPAAQQSAIEAGAPPPGVLANSSQDPAAAGARPPQRKAALGAPPSKHPAGDPRDPYGSRGDLKPDPFE